MIRMIMWAGGPSTYASCSTASMETYRWPWRPTMPGRMRSTATRHFPHSMKPGNMSGKFCDTTAHSLSAMASSQSVRSADMLPRRQQQPPRLLRFLPTNNFPARKTTVLLPASPFGFWEIRPVMGPDAVLSPQSRFRDTLRHLHHIFHFQCGSACEWLGHQLGPP